MDHRSELPVECEPVTNPSSVQDFEAHRIDKRGHTLIVLTQPTKSRAFDLRACINQCDPWRPLQRIKEGCRHPVASPPALERPSLSNNTVGAEHQTRVVLPSPVRLRMVLAPGGRSGAIQKPVSTNLNLRKPQRRHPQNLCRRYRSVLSAGRHHREGPCGTEPRGIHGSAMPWTG